MKRLRRHIVFFLGLSVYLALFSCPARAEGFVFTEGEKAVFAFHKLAGIDPEYSRWIRSDPEYERIPDDLKKDFVEEKEIRLKHGQGTYNPSKDFLNITTAVEIMLAPAGNSAEIFFRFPGHADNDIPYFPYAYGEEWIAVVAEDLGSFSRETLSEEDYRHLHGYFPDEGKLYPATLTFRLRPKSADAGKPLEQDGAKLWLMMGDVAAIRCVYNDPATGGEILLWEHSAPWYLSNTEKTLIDLLE